MHKVLTALFLVFALPTMLYAAPQQGGKKIQCWTDSKGQRSCGDSVPPADAQRERELYNNRGVIVAKKARQLTPEEAIEADRIVAAEMAAAKLSAEQRAYDKFLTDTYSNVKELEAARTMREQMLDGRMGLVKKAIVDNEKSLKDLRERAQAKKKSNPKADKRLQDQVKKYEVSLLDNQKSAIQLQEEKEKMVAKFNQDIERYKVLRP